MSKIRINKYLASIGVASRRKIDEMVLQGKISINGSPIKTLGFKVDPEKDEIKVDNQKVHDREHNEKVYIALHKPKGIVSTASDEFGRKTVLDLVKIPQRIYPIGRLDQDSSGLILLTNDGELTQRLSHPKFESPKTYEVYLQGKIDEWQLNKLRNGVILKDGNTTPAEVDILQEKDNRTLLQITIHEGRNRQIPRMCAAIKLNLLELKRVGIGNVKLGDLESGKWKYLTDEAVDLLKG